VIVTVDMKHYTINTTGGLVQFALCSVHEQPALMAGNERLVITEARPGEVCVTCERDRIRDAILGLGSVVA
jgi:hypothetical protein